MDPLGFWSEIIILGTPCLACLTADRAPDEVRLMREELDNEGVDLWAPILLGWTSAETFDELADAFSTWYVNGRARGRGDSTFLACADMMPDLEWERADRKRHLTGRRGRTRAPPIYKVWGQSGARVTLCDAQLDRKHNSIQLITDSNVVHRFVMREKWRPMPEKLQFFVVMPDDLRLRRQQCSHLHQNFMELPVPFLASTVRQL